MMMPYNGPLGNRMEKTVFQTSFQAELRYPNVSPRLVAFEGKAGNYNERKNAKAIIAGLPFDMVQEFVRSCLKQSNFEFLCNVISGKVHIAIKGKSGSNYNENPIELLLAIIAGLPLADSELQRSVCSLQELLYKNELLERLLSKNDGSLITISELSVCGNIINGTFQIATSFNNYKDIEKALFRELEKLEFPILRKVDK